MKTDKKEIKFINYKKYITAYIILAVSIILLTVMFKVSTVFATNYCNTGYKVFSIGIATVMSIFPFSVIEILIYVAIALVLYCIGRLIYLGIVNRKKPTIIFFKYKLKRYLLNLGCIVLACGLIFTLTCTPLYSRLSFAISADINVEPHTLTELKGLFKILAKNSNELCHEVSRDSDGKYNLKNIDYRKISRTAMKDLSDDYPCLSSIYPMPKKIIASKIMSYTFTQGFYSPYTMEANYNGDMPDINIPHTICHELAHLSGYIHEDEANFIGYLACMKSGNADFMYSGTIAVLTYVMNQLYDNMSITAYSKLISTFDEQVLADMRMDSAYWDSHEGTASQVSSTVNNAYIKANGDKEGEARYDMVTDLLLEYYEKDINSI